LTHKVIILGALSAVAEATARIYAGEGAALVLAGRRAPELARMAQDLVIRGASQAEVVAGDLAGSDAGAAIGSIAARIGGADIILLAYGELTDEARAMTDLGYAAQQWRVNALSPVLWSLAAAEFLRRQGSGVLIVIGSVAGDRGRASNALYGAAKAGLGTLVQGLAHRLAGTGARAVLVKPGFIDTPMTAHIRKGGPLWASPDAVAQVIVKAARKGGPIVYAPWFWRFILLAIRSAPSQVFHRTKL